MTPLRAAGLAAAAIAAAGCGDGAATVDASMADAEPAEGMLAVAWSIADGDELIACDDVGARTVSITAIPVDAFVGRVYPATCTAGRAGVGLARGTYDVRVELVAAAGRVGTARRFEGVAVEPGREVELEPITFDVARTGGVSFRLSARSATANCAGSGALDEVSLELRPRGGDCVPATFEIAEGEDRPAATYDSDCEGATTGCIDSDQLVTARGLTPGDYDLDVEASAGATGGCYRRRSLVDVPGGGLVEEVGTLLLEMRDACSVGADAGLVDGGARDGGARDGGARDGG